MTRQEVAERWINILRGKAEQYEHPARGKGETVFSPCIDDICNEIDVFFAGLPPKSKR